MAGGSQSMEEDELRRSVDRELRGRAESRGLKGDHCGCCEDQYHDILCAHWEGKMA